MGQAESVFSGKIYIFCTGIVVNINSSHLPLLQNFSVRAIHLATTSVRAIHLATNSNNSSSRNFLTHSRHFTHRWMVCIHLLWDSIQYFNSSMAPSPLGTQHGRYPPRHKSLRSTAGKKRTYLGNFPKSQCYRNVFQNLRVTLNNKTTRTSHRYKQSHRQAVEQLRRVSASIRVILHVISTHNLFWPPCKMLSRKIPKC